MSDTSPEQPTTPTAPKLTLKLPGQNNAPAAPAPAADSAPSLFAKPSAAPAPSPFAASPGASAAPAPAPSPFAPKPAAPGAPAPSPFAPKPAVPTLGGIPVAGSRPPPPTAGMPLTPGQISQAAKLPSGSAAFASPMPELDEEDEEEESTPIWQAILAFIGAAGAITCAVLLYLIDKQPV